MEFFSRRIYIYIHTHMRTHIYIDICCSKTYFFFSCNNWFQLRFELNTLQLWWWLQCQWFSSNGALKHNIVVPLGDFDITNENIFHNAIVLICLFHLRMVTCHIILRELSCVRLLPWISQKRVQYSWRCWIIAWIRYVPRPLRIGCSCVVMSTLIPPPMAEASIHWLGGPPISSFWSPTLLWSSSCGLFQNYFADIHGNHLPSPPFQLCWHLQQVFRLIIFWLRD